MKKIATLVLPLTLLLIPSCQEKTETETETTSVTLSKQEVLEQGGKVSSALLASLGPKLKGALKSGGPVHALQTCKQLAQPSTTEVSDDYEGLTLSRVSLKPRNPQNAPNALDTQVLTAWEKQMSDGGIPSDEVKYNNEGSAVFYRPIMTQEVCTKCHGDSSTFSKELVARLTELYPEDQATGYKEGQLRGAFRVVFPPQEK